MRGKGTHLSFKLSMHVEFSSCVNGCKRLEKHISALCVKGRVTFPGLLYTHSEQDPKRDSLTVDGHLEHILLSYTRVEVCGDKTGSQAPHLFCLPPGP